MSPAVVRPQDESFRIQATQEEVGVEPGLRPNWLSEQGTSYFSKRNDFEMFKPYPSEGQYECSGNSMICKGDEQYALNMLRWKVYRLAGRLVHHAHLSAADQDPPRKMGPVRIRPPLLRGATRLKGEAKKQPLPRPVAESQRRKSGMQALRGHRASSAMSRESSHARPQLTFLPPCSRADSLDSESREPLSP